MIAVILAGEYESRTTFHLEQYYKMSGFTRFLRNFSLVKTYAHGNRLKQT